MVAFALMFEEAFIVSGGDDAGVREAQERNGPLWIPWMLDGDVPGLSDVVADLRDIDCGDEGGGGPLGPRVRQQPAEERMHGGMVARQLEQEVGDLGHPRRAVLTLDEPYRTSILLRFYEGLDYDAIGRRTGVPTGTARVRVHRAVAKLRERLDGATKGSLGAWLAPLALVSMNKTAN